MEYSNCLHLTNVFVQLPVPDSLDDKTAAGFYINPITVLGLVETSAVPKGGWLLQTAAGSVLGRQMVQYAQHIGLNLISVVRRASSVDELKALGAEHVINSAEEDIGKRVREITGGKGVDAAVDPIGGETSGKVLSTLKRGGVLRVYGTLSGDTMNIRTRDIMAGRKLDGFIIYSWLPGLGEQESRKRKEKALQLLADKILTPLNGDTYPLEKFKEAITASQEPGRGAKLFLQ